MLDHTMSRLRLTLFGQGLAVVFALAAVILEWRFAAAFHAWTAYPFAVAVAAAALMGGTAAGVTTLAIANVALTWRLSPIASVANPGGVRFFELAAFDLTCLFLVWMIERYSRMTTEAARLRGDATRNFEMIANSAPSMVWVTDTTGQCTFFNHAWLAFTGRTLEQESGDGWTQGVHADDLDRCIATYHAAFSARQSFRMECRLRRSDGIYRWLDNQGVPRFSASGEFEGYIGSCIDIDDMENALREREEIAERLAVERSRLRNVVSNVPGVVWEAWGQPDESTQRVDFVSEHVERMLGYSSAEWLSTPNFWLTIVHPDDREDAAKNAAEHFAAGGTRTNSFRWVAKDGRAVAVEAHSMVITDDNGVAIGMCGVTMDVSARRHAEESLQFLARASDVLASSLDYETTISTAVSLALPHLADMCIVDLLSDDGLSIRRIAAAHARPELQHLADAMREYVPGSSTPTGEALRRGAPVVNNNVDATDLAARSRDGSHVKVLEDLGVRSYLAVPMAARGRTLGALVFTSERANRYDESDVELAILIARRAAIAVDNAQLYKAALAASSAKDDFLITVSHELRTPMTATLGWVRMLQADDLDEETRRAGIDAIDRSATAQARLIEDILDVSSIVHGKFRLIFADVDLGAVAEAAVETLQPAIAAKQMRVTIDRSRWSGTLRGDTARLQQVVWNLLSNALKFGHHGGNVRLSIERDPATARLVVADDGPGVDPELIPFVFDRFRQGETGTSRSFGGLGLGLAIVKTLVELHGGTARVESNPQVPGARFIMEFPLHAAPRMEPQVIDEVDRRLLPMKNAATITPPT